MNQNKESHKRLENNNFRKANFQSLRERWINIVGKTGKL